MARKLGVQYEGAIYHRMNRGDHREDIFLDDKDWQIALRLRHETTMTLAWIAQRLQMGTKTHLAHLLYWYQRPKT